MSLSCYALLKNLHGAAANLFFTSHAAPPLLPGEMVVGPAKVLFMDSISTGLDSSTTYLIVSCLRNLCHYMDQTVCISLLQPPPGEAGGQN